MRDTTRTTAPLPIRLRERIRERITDLGATIDTVLCLAMGAPALGCVAATDAFREANTD